MWTKGGKSKGKWKSMKLGKIRISVRGQISSAANLISWFWLVQQYYAASFSVWVLACLEEKEVN